MQNYCEVITIGDELLIGQVVDTNSAWIGQELNNIGLEIIQKTAVGDNTVRIVKALDEAQARANIILITGGLGPTKDDLTKNILEQYFNSGWRTDEKVLEHLKRIFAGREMLQVNLDQARVPGNCETIFNELGTAPGMWFEHNGKIIVSMPGVPYEMKKMMESTVLPRLEKFSQSKIIHKTLLTAGIGESFLSQKIAHIEDNLPPFIKLAYLPYYNTVRLRLTARGENEKELQKAVDEEAGKICGVISNYVIAEEDIRMEQLIGNLLKEKKKKVATAESCTGGYLAHLITTIPGGSSYFEGTVVSYSNDVKMNLLGVSKETLDIVGAVSKETVEQMVKGVLRQMNTDYAISTSGIAGPDGGTPDKPVGTVWIAVGNRERIVAEKFHFKGPRQVVVDRTAVMAFNMLRKMIQEDDGTSLSK